MAKGKYRLLFNTTYQDYNGNDIVEIGKIVDSETDQDALIVFYDKNLFRNCHYHMTPVEYRKEDKTTFAVHMDDTHRDILYSQPDILLGLLLHELGHHMNGDYRRDGDIETNREERMNSILEGRVQEVESRADAFAVDQIGKNKYLRCFDYLIKKRKERRDDGMELAIREFELRKKAVQRL